MAKVFLTTLGAKFGYAFETVSGTRPTSGYTEIEGVKSTPEMNPSPDTIETTTLNNTEFKTYAPGLKDLGGALGLTFGKAPGFATEWNTLCETAKTKLESGLAFWITIYVPGDTEAMFLECVPSKAGMSALESNSAYEFTVNVVPSGEPIWDEPVEPTPASNSESGGEGGV